MKMAICSVYTRVDRDMNVDRDIDMNTGMGVMHFGAWNQCQCQDRAGPGVGPSSGGPYICMKIGPPSKWQDTRRAPLYQILSILPQEES